MTTPSNYFYSGQVRAFISQFIKIVSNFYVEFGKDENGVASLQRVPVMYGDMNRQAAQIIRNNSENTTVSVPAMAVYIGEVKYDRERVQDPTLVQTMQIRQRQYDHVTGLYTRNQGEPLSVDRLMPAPYKLTLKLDIWTSNTDQKLQLFEQLTAMFNPALEIQSNDNYLDWTSLSAVFLTDVSWSSRTVPVGTDDPIDIATLTFELPIWISTSAKVKKMGVVQTVIANINDITSDTLSEINLTGNRVYSDLNYSVVLNYDNTNSRYLLKLLRNDDFYTDVDTGDVVISSNIRRSWGTFVGQYGVITPNLSKIRLLLDNGFELIGTISPHETDETMMVYSIFPGTLPVNTLPAVDAVIDPRNVNVAQYLTGVAAGTRYLLIDSIGSFMNFAGASAWKGTNGQDLVANEWDIVEYNGTQWNVVFDSKTVDTLEYVTNITSGIQYKWHNAVWSESVVGSYSGGQWSLNL